MYLFRSVQARTYIKSRKTEVIVTVSLKKMVHMNKLNKIKGIIKRWQSFRRSMGRSYSNLSSKSVMDEEWEMGSSTRSNNSVHAADREAQAPEGCKTVYVGKSRRKYFISAHHLNHPLLRVLVQKSDHQRCPGDDDQKESFAVLACEVVLFEHLVWMLENADPEVIQSYSLEELVEFYACS